MGVLLPVEPNKHQDHESQIKTLSANFGFRAPAPAAALVTALLTVRVTVSSTVTCEIREYLKLTLQKF